MELIRHITNTALQAERADVLLANTYPEYSRAALTKLFDMQKITKDSRPIKAGDKIQPHAIIVADISELAKKADIIPLPILYEDDNVIVIDKPAGIISHARGKYWDEASVASFIRDRISGFSGERGGIVHRLDRATSGVMICAKNQPTLSMLQRQFSERKVRKTYIAVVRGAIQPSDGLIDIALARSLSTPNTFIPDINGKHAQTEYHTSELSANYSKLLLHPLTGRTHQLRVHLQHMKHPIVGDVLYNGEPADRLYLHATSLEITIPTSERKVFMAPLPIEFTELLHAR